MDFALTSQFVNLGGLGIIAWFLVKNQTKQNNYFIEKMDKITVSIEKMTTNVGKTLLTPSQTTMLLKAVMHEHIDRKLEWVKDVLEKNDIHNRREHIIRNMRTKFMEITRTEAEKLSQFNTPAGDIGAILNQFVDWDKFVGECCEIIFSENTMTKSSTVTKCSDLKGLMIGYVNELLELVENKIRSNTI